MGESEKGIERAIRDMVVPASFRIYISKGVRAVNRAVLGLVVLATKELCRTKWKLPGA